MKRRTRIAFIKFAGMASGGVEKYLQTIACMLPKEEFEVDYYYTNAAPFINSNFVHPVNDPERLKLVESHDVNAIKVHVEAKFGDPEPYEWVNTDFWGLFNESNYDVVTTGGAGCREYPYHLINKTKTIATIHGFVGEDRPSIHKAILLCDWQANKWAGNGGNKDKAVVIPTIVKTPPKKESTIREELDIPKDAFVYGFHQGNREEIFSPVSLLAYNHIKTPNNYFVIMGGAQKHRALGQEINHPNIKFVDHSSSVERIHNFLAGIDVFAHARVDGEVCSAAIIESLYHGKPVITHPALNMGHAEQIDGCGKLALTMEEYVKEMLLLQNDKEYYHDQSAKALEKYNRKYDYDLVCDQILEVYSNFRESHDHS
jgi:glycosyltransferase involved in cell wall biosynthesis